MHATVSEVTARIESRSLQTRSDYLNKVQRTADQGTWKSSLSCGNQAHAFAASSCGDKSNQIGESTGNVGIVTSYNDMLSAHQPYAVYPDLIKEIARKNGGTAQVAGGVPAMCDGVTQGQPGMELSLFSRDVIAMSAGIALSHNVYDAAIFLGICDKIVPGLVIAAASFGHLPSIFLPAGSMPTGISNNQKAKVRQQFAAGAIGKPDLLKSEMQSYHSAGTCTFYGTANTNQMLMEFMGLQLPGSSFVNPDTPLREALNQAGITRSFEVMKGQKHYTPVAEILDIPNFVNGIVGLLATGGSTNLLIHLIAMARAAGIILAVQDFADLSQVTPLLAKVYPNGEADVNAFRDAGGLQFMIAELLNAGLLQKNVKTIVGTGLEHYTKVPELDAAGRLVWVETMSKVHDFNIVRPYKEPFQQTGGVKLLNGNLGSSVIKVSALSEDKLVIEAPAIVFNDQNGVKAAFDAGELNRDFICVVRFQGPQSNGMPELHGLTPVLGLLQDRGFKVALVTDGRMSGASGKVPAAIHVAPEAKDQGPIACIRDGDMIRLDAKQSTLAVLETDFSERTPVPFDETNFYNDLGRDLFSNFRKSVGSTTEGATVFFDEQANQRAK